MFTIDDYKILNCAISADSKGEADELCAFFAKEGIYVDLLNGESVPDLVTAIGKWFNIDTINAANIPICKWVEFKEANKSCYDSVPPLDDFFT